MSKAKRGFSTLETISSLVIFSSLSAGALPQFTSLENTARTASTQGILGAVRTSLELQKMNMLIRCGATLETPIHIEQLNSNDITQGGNAPCQAAQIPTSAEKRFLSDKIPHNPFKISQAVTSCTYFAENPCLGIEANSAAGWCYDQQAGKFWANSDKQQECKL